MTPTLRRGRSADAAARERHGPLVRSAATRRWTALTTTLLVGGVMSGCAAPSGGAAPSAPPPATASTASGPASGGCGSSALAVTLTPAPAETLVTFDRAVGQTPENLAIRLDGTVFVTLAFSGQVERVGTDGRRSTVQVPTAGGLVAGVVVDERRDVLLVAVRSTDPGAAGIWSVPEQAFDDGGGIRRLAALPVDAFPNGMALDARGDLFVTDADRGRVWKVAAGAAEAQQWSSDELLGPDGSIIPGSTFPFPGANGVEVTPDGVLVSNTARKTLLLVPVGADGSAGTPQVVCQDLRIDDFAVSDDGTVYAATNVDQSVIRIGRDGSVTQLAAAPRDPFDGPSSVAIDPRDPGRLLVTNSAFFSTPARPSLSALRVGTGA